MATSNPHAQGVESGAASLVTRPMIDTQTPGQALVTAVFAGPGLLETYTGIDVGTGDVTIYMPSQPQVAGKTLTEVLIDDFGRVVGGTFGASTSLSDTGVTPGAYGSASGVGTFTVDVKGRLTLAATVPIAITTSQITDLGVWQGSTSITTLGTVVTGTWNAGVIQVPYGGTGRSTWTQYGVVYADTTTSLTAAAPNTSTVKQFFSMVGTGSAGAAPVWSTLVVSDISNIGTWTGSTSITTLGTVVTGTWNAGVIQVPYGGTGLSSYSTGDLLVATSPTVIGKLSDVVAGNVLLSGGVNAVPYYGKIDLGVHVTGVLPPVFGGTGTAIAPTAGQLLVGTSSGVYVPTAISGTSPITVNAGSGSLQIAHAVSGATAGSYGSTTNIPVITVNTTGHITGISQVALSVSGIASLNQPLGQVVVGNGTGLTSFTGFLYDNTTTKLTVGSTVVGVNPDYTGFAIGLSLGSGEWAFGQDNVNTLVNSKSGGGIAFSVDATTYGSLGPTGVWQFNTAGITILTVTTKLTLGYLAGSAGMLVVNSAGDVSSQPIQNNKVAYDAADTASYLPDKIRAGAGITFTTVISGTGKSIVVNSRTNSWRPVSYLTTSAYTVLDTDDTLIVNAASSASTSVILPLPGTAYQGRLVTVQHVGAVGATTTVSSAGTISGLSPVVSTAYGKLEFFCATTGSGFIWVCRA